MNFPLRTVSILFLWSLISLDNSYIVPSNVWFSRNPFSRAEFSWYAVTEYVDDSYVRMNRSLELILTEEEKAGNSMLGLFIYCKRCCGGTGAASETC